MDYSPEANAIAKQYDMDPALASDLLALGISPEQIPKILGKALQVVMDAHGGFATTKERPVGLLGGKASLR